MPRRTKISIENLHPNYKPDKKKIASLAKRILSAHRSNLDLDIILVKDQFIQQLNKNFRKKDKVTDVLSFGMREGKKIGLELNYLGDIYVCLDQAKRQAKEYGIPFAEEVYRLVTHGILHLLGYEHKAKKQTKEMKKKEELFVAQIRNMRPLKKYGRVVGQALNRAGTGQGARSYGSKFGPTKINDLSQDTVRQAHRPEQGRRT